MHGYVHRPLAPHHLKTKKASPFAVQPEPTPPPASPLFFLSSGPPPSTLGQRGDSSTLPPSRTFHALRAPLLLGSLSSVSPLPAHSATTRMVSIHAPPPTLSWARMLACVLFWASIPIRRPSQGPTPRSSRSLNFPLFSSPFPASPVSRSPASSPTPSSTSHRLLPHSAPRAGGGIGQQEAPPSRCRLLPPPTRAPRRQGPRRGTAGRRQGPTRTRRRRRSVDGQQGRGSRRRGRRRRLRPPRSYPQRPLPAPASAAGAADSDHADFPVGLCPGVVPPTADADHAGLAVGLFPAVPDRRRPR
ncbi:proline-rich receptor-like protein kinase PERK8 [Lolium rigidum]|uniref:proline-rich receptor-like protein kinase PERK8 n=1 Tax=Lolium rigidum TaxID=89674 RepID=UPI001F5D49E0|nr:proline-rich receptor-like protein kinase PERK8 [Lolium rigidum]